MADETIRIITDTAGTEKVRALTAAYEVQQKALQALIQQGQAFSSQSMTIAQDMARIAQQIRATQATMSGGGMGGGGGGGAYGAGGSGTNKSVVASMAMLNFGQMMEDAQYGFRAVANQIPMMTGQLAMLAGMSGPTGMALGGLAAIISTIGVQAYESSSQFKAFVDGMAEKSKEFGTMAAHLAPLAFGVIPPDFNFAFETADQGKTRAANEKAQKAAAATMGGLGGLVGKDQQDRAKQVRAALEQFGGEAFGKAMLGGHENDANYKTTVGSLVGRAQKGDAIAIKDMEKYLDPTSLRKWQEAMRDNDAKVIESRKIATEAREAEFTETTKQARSMKELSEIAAQLKGEFNAGKITLKQYTDRKKDIASAEDAIDRKERQKADEEYTRKTRNITTIEQVAKAEQDLEKARSAGKINQDQYDSRSRQLKHIRENEEIDELNRQGQANQPGRFQIAQAEEFVARGEMRKANRNLTRAYFQAGRAATRGVGGQLTRQLLGRQEQAVLGGMDIQEALQDYFSADTDADRQAVMSRVGKMSGQMQTQFRMGAQQFQMMQRMGLAPSRAEMKAVDQVERLNRKQAEIVDKWEKAADKLLSGDFNITL